MAGAVVVLAAVVAVGWVSTAIAVKATELGKTRQNAKPACPTTPRSDCEVTGQVTGFQRTVDGKANLFKAPGNGKVVAWSIDLSKPAEAEREAFGEAAETEGYGKSPTAGISILRKKGNGKFRLLRASPVLRVQRYYGEQPIFTLRDPLKVNKGNIVALTTVTWLPAFANENQGRDDVWVGSRTRKNCNLPDPPPANPLEYFFAHTRPHRKVGTERKYACEYDRARLLYWAYFAPKR